MIEELRAKYSRGQFIRYVMVGAWNTLFGYAVYAVLTYMLTGVIPYAYMAASVLGSVVAITVAYIGHKFIVFKTKGNYLREYLRFYVVYGGAAAVNLVLLPFLVSALNFFLRDPSYSPYIAGAILTAVTVLFSFVGHKHYSFST